MTQAIERIRHIGLRQKIMTADEAAEFVQNGMLVGMSGFTGAGYPKALPTAIAEKAKTEHAQGKPFTISVITGASTAPECDGVMVQAGCLNLRSPFITDQHDAMLLIRERCTTPTFICHILSSKFALAFLVIWTWQLLKLWASQKKVS